MCSCVIMMHCVNPFRCYIRKLVIHCLCHITGHFLLPHLSSDAFKFALNHPPSLVRWAKIRSQMIVWRMWETEALGLDCLLQSFLRTPRHSLMHTHTLRHSLRWWWTVSTGLFCAWWTDAIVPCFCFFLHICNLQLLDRYKLRLLTPKKKNSTLQNEEHTAVCNLINM